MYDVGIPIIYWKHTRFVTCAASGLLREILSSVGSAFAVPVCPAACGGGAVSVSVPLGAVWDSMGACGFNFQSFIRRARDVVA